jgi:hypothetical protein
MKKADSTMPTSSPDQPTMMNTSPRQAPASKRRLWLRLLITFITIVLIIFITLVLLTYTKILPPQWFVPLLATLAPIVGGIGAFVNTTLSDKDFQQALRKRLIGLLSDEVADRTNDNKDSKDATPQATSPSGITITVSPTITNTNIATSTADAAIESPKRDLPHHPESAINRVSLPEIAQLPVRSLTSSDSIFFVGTKLTDPREFYGRAIERAQLLSRTRNGGCTSIIGPRRIGKSWLMTYLLMVAPQQLGTNFRIGSMNAALPSTATVAGFSLEALKALGSPFYALPPYPDLKLLENFVRDLVAQNHKPILCIDEFERLAHHAEFDLDFFEGLRAITEIGLGLVVLSQKPLIEIVGENTRTSPFFNVFLQLSLVPFDRDDAEIFWHEKGAQAQFTSQERTYARTCSQTADGQFPPLRLQLVGNMLLTEKYAADPVARQRYRPAEPEYWQTFRQRVDVAYGGMVKS